MYGFGVYKEKQLRGENSIVIQQNNKENPFEIDWICLSLMKFITKYDRTQETRERHKKWI